jgi:DNA-binding MarR family transcriptional regulator
MSNKKQNVSRITAKIGRIINAHMEIEKHSAAIDDGPALSPGEGRGLQAIGYNPGSNIKKIGDILGVSKSAASQMVSRLERKGLVVKGQDPDNEKDRVACLTEIGHKVFGEHKNFNLRHTEKLVSRLSETPGEVLENADFVLGLLEDIMHERMRELFRD